MGTFAPLVVVYEYQLSKIQVYANYVFVDSAAERNVNYLVTRLARLYYKTKI